MPKEVNGKKQNKENKHFMKDFKTELKKVTWPTPKQLFNNTLAVIAIVLITAIIVAVLDLTFRTIDTYGIEGIKSLVESRNQVENTESGENDIEENTTVNETVENEEASNEVTNNEQNSEENQNNTENE